MEFPRVAVSEINYDEATRLAFPTPSSERLHLIRETVDRGGKLFILTWEGGKIPRGAEIGGQVIAFTKNNAVHGEGGSIIGFCEHLVEFGGRYQKDQKMLVFLLPKFASNEVSIPPVGALTPA